MLTVSSEKGSKDTWRERLFLFPYSFPTLKNVIGTTLCFPIQKYEYISKKCMLYSCLFL